MSDDCQDVYSDVFTPKSSEQLENFMFMLSMINPKQDQRKMLEIVHI